MYIIAIAWLYVTVLMAATEPNITAGLLTFFFYGLLPCAIFLWLFGSKHRHYKRNQRNKNEKNPAPPIHPDLLQQNEASLEQVVEEHHSQHTEHNQ